MIRLVKRREYRVRPDPAADFNEWAPRVWRAYFARTGAEMLRLRMFERPGILLVMRALLALHLGRRVELYMHEAADWGERAATRPLGGHEDHLGRHYVWEELRVRGLQYAVTSDGSP